jgi:hypothetical protein
VYEPAPQETRPGCRDSLVLTRVVFSVVLPPLIAIVLLIAALGVALILFAVHPALALLPVAGIGAGILLFARWEQRRYRGP